MGLPDDLMPEVTYSEGTPATYNNPQLTHRVHDTLEKLLGEDKVHYESPVMGAEDFAHYGRVEPKIPSLIFRLGTVSEEYMAAVKAGEKKFMSLHSSYYAPDLEPSLKTGVAAMTTAVLDLLGTK